MLPPINFKNWIDKNRHLLKPPVGNQVVYEDTEFIIMVVGGPNTRKDYHIDEGEEFFYQLEGRMVLRIIENKKPKDININEGEIFLLPPKVPHSPQRFENTVGLVIERKRRKGELDAFQWYCDACHTLLYEYLKNATMRKRNIYIIILALFIGSVFGGVIGNVFSLILPESVVKDFFLTSVTFDIGGFANNELGVFIIDLKIIVLKLGLSVSFNFTSVIGIAVAYYILRYLR